MSRYDDLCQAYINSRNDYFSYQKECLEFSTQLLNGLVHDFQIPEERVRVIPVIEPAEAEKGYDLAQVMKLSADTFWHFGLEITLCERPDLCLQQVMIRFRIKKEKDHFVVKLGNRAQEEFRIAPELNGDFRRLYDYIFNFVKNAFEHGLDEFLENPQPDNRLEKPRKIGF